MSAQTPADGGIHEDRAAADRGPAAQVPAAQVPAAQVPAAQVPAAQVPADRSRAAQVPADRSRAAQVPADRVRGDRALAGRPPVVRVLLTTAVCIGVAALAAAVFLLSYSAIHSFALQAGVPARLARAVPLMIDAMLVVALAGALALRGAGLPSRLLAWVILLAVLAAGAGADAMHADGRTLPHRVAAVTVAVVPWALVLLAFVLLLAMLRYARLRRQTVGSGRSVLVAAAVPAVPADTAFAASTAPDHGAMSGQPAAGLPAPLDLSRRPAQAPLSYGPPEAASAPYVSSPLEAGSPLVTASALEAAPPLEAASALEAVPQEIEPRPQEPGLPITDSLWDRLAGPRWETRASTRQQAALDPDAASVAAASDGAPSDGVGADSSAAAGPIERLPAAIAGPVSEADAAPSGDSGPDAPLQPGPLPASPLPASPAPASTIWDRPSEHSAGDSPGEPAPGSAGFAPASATADDHQDADMPVFHRLWSSPTPPSEQG